MLRQAQHERWWRLSCSSYFMHVPNRISTPFCYQRCLIGDNKKAVRTPLGLIPTPVIWP